MTRMIKQPITIVLTLLLLSTSTMVFAARNNLINFVEFQLPTAQLLSFSSQGVRVNRCPSCAIDEWRIDQDTQFYDQNQAVDLQTATHLFVTKPYSHVSLFVDRQQGRVSKVVFGGFIEIAPINHELRSSAQ
ncbi:MAG: hypothetical protein IBX52_04095 [Bacterioplanes sp.]|nr:hypothetical protein [Bacterioplanes sp.]